MLGMCPPTNYLLEAGENAKKTTKGMFFVNTNEKSPFALGKWTDLPSLGLKNPNASMMHPPSITIMQPMQSGDPLLRHIDQWGKLDYNFNNFNGYESSAYVHDPYDDNWTYFSDDPAEIENNLNANSVEEQDIDEYTFGGSLKQQEHHEHSVQEEDIEWQEYKRNASGGYIDRAIFGVPILDGR